MFAFNHHHHTALFGIIPIAHLLQMCLQLVPGVCGFADSGVEGVVDGVEVVPHVIGTLAEGAVNLPTQSLAGGTLFLGSGDVLLGVAGPRLGDGDAGRGDKQGYFELFVWKRVVFNRI